MQKLEMRSRNFFLYFNLVIEFFFKLIDFSTEYYVYREEIPK